MMMAPMKASKGPGSSPAMLLHAGLIEIFHFECLREILPSSATFPPAALPFPIIASIEYVRSAGELFRVRLRSWNHGIAASFTAKSV